MSTEGTQGVDGSTAYPATMWDKVRKGDPQRMLEHLSRHYERPIRRWFERKARRWRLDEADASDLMQGFFAMVAGGRDIGIEQVQGKRFRSWLQTCLGNFFTDEMRKRKRRLEDPTKDLPEPPPEDPTEGERLDLDLAGQLHGQILGMLRGRWTSSGRGDRFALLEGYLPLSDEEHPSDAGPFGNANNRRQALSRLRDEYMEEFEQRTRDLASAADLEEEQRYLMECILRAKEG